MSATPVTPAPTEKVAIIGSGNWGSVIARIVGENVFHFDRYDKEVRMWVYEELIEGRKLTEIINQDHENVKYLPGFKIPENVLAVPDLEQAVKDATLLVFVLPHQFLPRLFPAILKGLDAEAVKAGRVKACSLIKGIDYDEKGLVLISDTIRKGLGGIAVSVLMGANVANEVAAGNFCEATLGHRLGEEPAAAQFRDIFDTAFFRIGMSADADTVELCGALKNVVALGAGFCDGLGFGSNTKAAIMRMGLVEMKEFCKQFYGGANLETFFESCGVADLITTCFSGRNRKCAEAFAASGGSVSWESLEAQLLGGQKLQGTLTAAEVHHVLSRTGSLAKYPLFNVIYKIMQKEVAPAELVRMQAHVPAEQHAHPEKYEAAGHGAASSWTGKLALPPAALGSAAAASSEAGAAGGAGGK